MPISIPELLIVLAIVLLLVGGKRLPGIGRGLGTGMREFKDSITGRGGSPDDEPARDRVTAGDGAADGEPLTGDVVGERRPS
jgi:sec-independent protein translocase protein TatA